MKGIRVGLSLGMLFLLLCAWYTVFSGGAGKKQSYEKNIATAKNYMERELYQKAIIEYDEALSYKEDKKVREDWVLAYQKAYESETTSLADYENALLLQCNLYPTEKAYWERLIKQHIDREDYREAYRYYRKATENKVKSDKIEEYRKKILYSFSIDGRTCRNFVGTPFGDYVIERDEKYGVISAKGDDLQACEFVYISPCNEENTAFYVSQDWSRVIDDKQIVQAVIHKKFQETKGYGDGFLPVKAQDGWRFYDCEKEQFMLDVYEDVSVFSNKIALVKSNGKWRMINQKGECVSETIFDDVKLYGNGMYCYKDTMIASAKGKYGIYNVKGELVKALEYSDADNYYDDLIAVKNAEGKWGYVDREGKEIIKPQYAEAKSFSNGMAAVYDGGKWGCINSNGELVVDYQFLSADYLTKDHTLFVSDVEDNYYLIHFEFL